MTVASNMAGAAPLVGHEGPGHELLQTAWGPGISRSRMFAYLLLGAPEVCEETLNRFYILHCIALPLLTTVLMAIHFWRGAKRPGASVVPEQFMDPREIHRASSGLVNSSVDRCGYQATTIPLPNSAEGLCSAEGPLGSA